jgi:pimeloyl-ACP methyl ester carboxylesterase
MVIQVCNLLFLAFVAIIKDSNPVDSFLIPSASNTLVGKSSSVLYSASFEEAEDLLYYGVTAPNIKKKGAYVDSGPPKSIQRVYETWSWSYDTKLETTSQATYNINYRVDGKEGRPPILLIHGFGANVNHFRYQFPALCDAGYRVYALDLLGFGASSKPLNAADIGFSIELFTQQILDFLTYIQTKDKYENVPWTLAGNSIGGLCCLTVAAELEKQPFREKPSSDSCSLPNISSIVLFNTSGGMTGFRYEDVPIWVQPILAFFQFVVLGPFLGGNFFRNFRSRENIERILKESGVYGDTTNVNDELLEVLLEPADDEGAEQVFLAVFGGPAGPTAESILPNVKVPVLAFWGTKDPWTPIDVGLHPGRCLPPYHGSGQFTLVPLDGAGHCPHDECPAIVNEKMIEFMNQISTSASSRQQTS